MNDYNSSWSSETQQCLQNLNLVLSCYSETYKELGVPGCAEIAAVYSSIAQKVAEINRGGPATLEREIDKSSVRATVIHQALRNQMCG